MEPVTHLLTGAALGRTGFNRKTALATLTMTLAAEAPDIDILAYIKGSAYGFAEHRGVTHTLVGVPLVAAGVVLSIYAGHALFQKLRSRTPRPGAQPIRWGLLYLFACIASLSHLLLDFTNNYGIRPFYPFSSRWYSWDIVFIIEPVMLALLAAGLILPHLFGLINSEIGARQKGPRGRVGAIAALLGIVLMWGVRDYQHRHALHAMEALQYRGADAIHLSAFPYPTNPFIWYGVVETSGFYEAMRVDSLRPEVDPDGRAVVYYKPDETPAMQAARNSYLGRAYLDWARYPLLEVQRREAPDPGYDVTFRDVRFMYPEHKGVLTAYVELDPALRVEEQGFVARNGKRD